VPRETKASSGKDNQRKAGGAAQHSSAPHETCPSGGHHLDGDGRGRRTIHKGAQCLSKLSHPTPPRR
jgi:hypothetical protein